MRLSDKLPLIEFDESLDVKVDSFRVSSFRVTHSIPDSFGIVVDTAEGRIVSTGDFKVDLTPIGPDINLTRMAELGREGVNLLLSDSTNAENEGYTPSEKNVFDAIDDVFNKASGRLIISTFSSNISRIQQICEVAYAHNRKIVIVGRSMEKAMEIARSYGYIKMPAFIVTLATMLIYRSFAQYCCQIFPKAILGGGSSVYRINSKLESYKALYSFGNGKLGVGTTGYIYFVDFDRTRPRPRKCKIVIIGE